MRAGTPPPMQAVAGDDANAVRGARNVVTRCLCVQPGERVHVLTHRAGGVYRYLAAAVEEAGGVTVRVPLEPIASTTASVAEHTAKLAPLLAGATATVLLAPERPPPAMSVAIAKTAESMRARHLHLLQVDERLLAQSVRADPELLTVVNDRLRAALASPCDVRVTSESGTDVEVQLSSKHPLLASSGRPTAGTSENLPAGHVYTHPAKIQGTLVVDRAIFGPGVDVDRSALNRSPPRVTLAHGKVTRVESSDPAIQAAIEAYLASHAYADHVGLLVFPTNYLVRSESRIDRQDMLLPGMSVSLGYASADSTRAPYEAPVQMVFLGRRQTVRVGERSLVDGGRFAEDLVSGIDPFR
jgi:hypothetical protein